MPRGFRSIAVLCAATGCAVILIRHAPAVHAQSTNHLQIASFTVSADQKPVWPNAAPTPYLLNLPDEHTTFIPSISGGAPYLVFGASRVTGDNGSGGAVVLQTTDLTNFPFATSLGYNTQVFQSPVAFTSCNPIYDTEFDENYAAPGSVVQDPTLPAGNLIAIYEAENHCPGGVTDQPYYATVGFMRSSDNGKTWPAPANGPLGNAARHPIFVSSEPEPSTSHPPMGNAIPSAFVEKSADGNQYLYVAYTFHGTGADGITRVGRAKLGPDPLAFNKWFYGSFSQPGAGGLDSGVTPSGGCGANVLQEQPQISFNDDLGLYLLTFVCQSNGVAGWFYSTATSLDLEDWSAPQLIANSQFPFTPNCGNGASGSQFDGWYPSFMSPGAAAGHTKLSGMVFFQNGCDTGPRVFASRTLTITTQTPPAPVLTSGTVLNGATYVPGGLVPGSFASLNGSNITTVTRTWRGFDFFNLSNKLPQNLSGVSLTVNGNAAAIYYIAPNQIDFLVPDNIGGTAVVQVTNNGVSSNTVTAPSTSSSPGIFPYTLSSVNYPAAVFFSDGLVVGNPANGTGYRQAKPGDIIEFFATGVTIEPGDLLANYQSVPNVSVTIGTVTGPASACVLTYAGEFQINFTVPQQFASMPAGNYPLSITVGTGANAVSSPVTIDSNPPGEIVLPITH